jgi:uncharacterized membrane protein HdeD (DUF308 family)
MKRKQILGLSAVVTGSLALLSGHLHYSNFWHAPVFAPFAIVVGILSLIAAFTHRNRER